MLAQESDQLVVFGVNDTPGDVEAELQYGVFNLAGGMPIDHRSSATLAANASTRLASFPSEQWREPTRSAAFALLRQDERVIARNRLFAAELKDMEWPRAEVTVEARDGVALLRSDAFAWGVCLDLDGELPLADNFLDVYPGMPYALPWPHAHPPQIVRGGFNARRAT
jgi:beta-mannosidase